jgi:uncharacterized protein YidB (DUF937 family)
MGFLDILNGMQSDPRGQRDSNSGGMSPIIMAILGLLAQQAFKQMRSGQAVPAPAPGPGRRQIPPTNSAAAEDRTQGGGLDDLLKGGLGGLLAGGAAGSVLSGGLNDLLKQFQNAGQGDIADSWVGNGPNKDISENELARAIGVEQIDALTGQTGLSRQELLTGLSRELPGVVDELTPDGRLPTEAELSSRWRL